MLRGDFMASISSVKLFYEQKGVGIAHTVITQLGCGILSFCMSGTSVFSEFFPFGTAFVCALPGEFSLLSMLGGIVGALSSTGSQSVRYVTTLILALALKWVFTELFSAKRRLLICSLCPLASFLITGGATVFLSGQAFPQIFVYLSEGFLSAGCSYFLQTGLGLIIPGKKSLPTPLKMTAGIISLSIILISLTRFTVFGISPARAAAAALIIFAGYYGKEAAGAIFGLAFGLSLCLVDQNQIYASMGFAFGGLMSGIFGRMSKISCCIAFLLANCIVILRDMTDTSSLIILYEVLAGSVLFFAVPSSLSGRLLKVLTPGSTVTASDGAKDSAVLRLKFASEALEDVSDTVDTVAQKLSAITSPNFEKVFSKTELDCCKGCGLRIYCWETNRGKTVEALLSAAKSLKLKRAVSVGDLPNEFSSRCAHCEALLDSLSENFSDFLSRSAAERRLCEVRSVISQQFHGLSQMLYGLSEEFKQSDEYLPETAELIGSALLKLGVNAEEICCRQDMYGRMTVEIKATVNNGRRISSSSILKELCRVCERSFERPSITELENSVLITVCEKAEYTVDLGVCQINCDDNRLCGDAVTTFSDGKGHFYMLLSDGMGSGGRAAVDGAMASGLMSRLLKAGFGADCSLNIVNSAMLFKSTDESLATLDITEIDLFSGYGRFFKAGAPVTVVRRLGKTVNIESETVPAGILKNVAFSKSDLKLSKGDIVVMMSDGATESGFDWIGVETEVWKDGSAQELAEHLADYAQRRLDNDHGDDITVMVGIIEKAI